MILTDSDLIIAAKTIWGEARGEDFTGKMAVAEVIVNRAIRTDGQFALDTTLAVTCLRSKQFSCWNPHDPNMQKMLLIGPDDVMYRSGLEALLRVINNGAELTLTNGATHYHTKKVSPSWSDGHIPSAIIGSHLFYNDVK